MIDAPQCLQVMRTFLPRTFASGTEYCDGQAWQATIKTNVLSWHTASEHSAEGPARGPWNTTGKGHAPALGKETVIPCKRLSERKNAA